jgi:polyhydroxyalkanoate synthesis regulator phasin
MSTATDIAALKTRCSKLEQRVAAAEAKNVAQDTAIAAVAARVTTLEAAVAALKSKLTR